MMFNWLVANEKQGVRQNLMSSAKILAALVDNEIDTHIAIAATLARSSELREGDLPAFQAKAAEALSFVPGAWLTVSDPHGQLLLSTLTPPGSSLPRHIAPEISQRAFETRKPVVADLVFGPVSKRYTAFAEIPVFQNGVPQYTLSISLSPDRFFRLIENRFVRGELVGILDRTNRLVARNVDHTERVATLAAQGWLDGIAKAREGWTENQTLDGDMVLNAYTETRHGWIVGVSQLVKALERPLHSILLTTVLATIIFITLSVTLASLIARHTSRSMAALARAAEAVGRGQAMPNMPQSFAEAGVIAAALANASAELQARGDQLIKANADLEIKVAERTGELMAEMQRRQETESTLRQSEKMNAIGQLTGGIAHDFNNMLTVIMGNLDLMQRRLRSMDLPQAAPLARPVEAALAGARSAAKLTHRLLAFSRQQPLEPTKVDLNALIVGMADMLGRTVGETIRLETVSGAGLWPTFVDANQVENCLVNLTINARDAMPEGGKLTIETANVFLDEAYVAQFGDLKSGQYVLLSVTDTGAGIPADKLDRVFEPFFTTKDPGKGTGLGLAMVHGFIKQSGGHIRIYSEVGEGTTIKLYLPRLLESSRVVSVPRAAEAADEPPRDAQPGETVLLVEDDDGVREYAIGILEDLGYRVLAAAGGSDAMRLISPDERVDLLFTDVVLADSMTGRQLADKLVELRPSLPVLFTTGYTRNAIIHQGRLDAGVHLLNKPYTQRDLAGKIRQLLDR